MKKKHVGDKWQTAERGAILCPAKIPVALFEAVGGSYFSLSSYFLYWIRFLNQVCSLALFRRREVSNHVGLASVGVGKLASAQILPRDVRTLTFSQEIGFPN